MTRRILFDASPMLDIKKTGVGYYVHNLFESLQQNYENDVSLIGYYFNFLNRNSKVEPAISGLNYYKIWLVPGKILSLCRRIGFQPFLEFFVNKPSEAIIFTNYVSLPSLRTRRIALIIYDLGFLDVPEFTQEVNLRFLKKFCPPSIRQADVIITISEFTKSRLQYHFPDLKAAIVITPIPPVAIGSSSNPLPTRLTAMGLKPGSYILYLGTIEPRKNIQNLLKSYAMLEPNLRQQFPLVLAGGKGWRDEAIVNDIKALKAAGIQIVTPGYISDAEKDTLYRHSRCFVLPSHYEGFGMPVLEAMQYDIPVAVSDIAVFREVAGTAARYFDKDDPRQISAALHDVITQETLRKNMILAGRKCLKTYSWPENAHRVYEALQ